MYPPVLLGLEAGLAIPQLPVPLVSTCTAKDSVNTYTTSSKKPEFLR